MGRQPLLLQPAESGQLIEVAEMWPRGRSSDGSCAAPASCPTQSFEALAAYRRHRYRLVDALRPDRSNGAEPAVRDEPTELFAPEVLEAAAALYDPALPYHNVGHALRAVACGERLLRVCATEGVPVDGTVVRLALLFHDAGYGTDPSTVGCPDPEAYSAWLARRVLSGRVPAPVLAGVSAAIMATRYDACPTTPEAKVVRAADLGELAADYNVFATNAEALRVEHELLTGAPPSAEDWGRSVDLLLNTYLREPLWPLELLDGPGQAGFHAVAKANLSHYLDQLH